MSLDSDTGGILTPFGLSLVQPAVGTQDHHRRFVRNLILGALKEVFESDRVHSVPGAPLQARPQEWKLPALNVFTSNDASALETKRVRGHGLELVVDVVGHGSTVVDMVDELEGAVDAALRTHPRLQEEAGHIQTIDLTSSEASFSDSGARAFGSRRLTFQVTYSVPL